MFCPECRSEYVEGITICADCQVALVEELEPLPKEEYEYENFVTLKTYFTRAEAEIDHSVLEANGLEAFVVSDDSGGVRPELAFFRGVKLWVHQDDVEKARETFDALEKASLENGSVMDEEQEEVEEE